MGLFRRKPTIDPAQLAAVASDVAAVAREVAAVREQLEALGRRFDTADADRLRVADVVGALQHRVASIGSELTNQFTELSGEIDALQARPDPAAALAAVDGLRADVDGVTTSVAGLRDDLGGVQSGVDDLAANVKDVESQADGLRSGQERLANEQVRYQIAFRDDLAALADQLARKRT